MEDKKIELIKKYKSESKCLFEEYLKKLEDSIYSATKEHLDADTIIDAFFQCDIHCEYDEYVYNTFNALEMLLLNKYGYFPKDIVDGIVATRSRKECEE